MLGSKVIVIVKVKVYMTYPSRSEPIRRTSALDRMREFTFRTRAFPRQMVAAPIISRIDQIQTRAFLRERNTTTIIIISSRLYS